PIRCDVEHKRSGEDVAGGQCKEKEGFHGRVRRKAQEFHQEAGVGVGSHRRDSRMIFERLIFDGFSRSTSSRISSMARRRSSSSAGPSAGWRIQSGLPLSVTWTGLPARVMRFTLSGSWTNVRSVIVFTVSDTDG